MELINSDRIVSISRTPVIGTFINLHKREVGRIGKTFSMLSTLSKVWMRDPVEANRDGVYLAGRDKFLPFFERNARVEDEFGILNVGTV